MAAVCGHDWNGVRWRINLPETTTPVVEETTTTAPIRLIDWREWSQMKSTYVQSARSPPLLIVDSSPGFATTTSGPPTTTYVIPEATIETESSTAASTTSTEETTTTSTSTTPSTTTTTEQTTNTTTAEVETTTAKLPDVTLELRSLPDVLSLLKHLAVIPAVVRSFSSAAAMPSSSNNVDAAPMTNPLNAILTAHSQPRVDELRSRALSANSGYGARPPMFVTAPPAESEAPQIFSNRRAPILNVPAPIVPVNNEGFRPREVAPLQPAGNPHRLNIYGVESVPASRNSYDAPMLPEMNEVKKTRPRFDLSNLTVGEVEQLESIHRKLFHGGTPTNLTARPQPTTLSATLRPPPANSPSPLPLTESEPLVVFKQPEPPPSFNSLSAAASRLPSDLNASSLKPEMIDELVMIKDIPNLDELTQGSGPLAPEPNGCTDSE
ncbi:hypothetical protein M3Y99_00501600 [Aphelenchoides fujianensis]|nr:hypothetical protein M3Y99_00501600 [Aphelenchoides fujianensis]